MPACEEWAAFGADVCITCVKYYYLQYLLTLKLFLLLAEVKFLESFYFVADLFEAAGVAVCCHAFENLGDCLGDVSCLLFDGGFSEAS